MNIPTGGQKKSFAFFCMHVIVFCTQHLQGHPVWHHHHFLWQVKDDTARIKRDMSDALRDAINKGERPQFVRRIYISLPKTEDHKYHVIGEVCYSILLTCSSIVSLLVRKSHSLKIELYFGQLIAKRAPPPTTLIPIDLNIIALNVILLC